MKVKLTGRLICANDGEAELVRRLLPEHVALTRAEAGCLSFEVLETEDPLVWSVDELFADQDSFHAHQARAAASAWGVETSAIKRDYAIFNVAD